MQVKIIEFKARMSDLSKWEEKLASQNPRFVGEDHQIDTYFNCPTGRLKLREGNIENTLIYYDRPDIKGLKRSDVTLYKHPSSPGLKSILSKTLGVKVVVDKRRKIYFVDNVKIHFDHVVHLGTFLEVEAIDEDGSFNVAFLEDQCSSFKAFFDIAPNQFVEVSYSDLMLKKQME